MNSCRKGERDILSRDFLIKHFRAHLVFYLLVTVLFLGALVLGAVGGGGYLPEKIFTDLETTIERFMTGRATLALDSRLETMEAFSSNARFLLLSFLCGIASLGFPGVLFLAAYRGYLLGATMSMMIVKYGWSGFLWFFLAVFPQNLLLIPMILLATAWSADFSLSVLLGRWEGRLILGKSLRFMVGYGFLLLLGLGAAVIQGFAAPYFVTLFAD